MPDDPLSPEDILARLVAAGAPASSDRAQILANEIAAHGGLDHAIAALTHDQAFAVLNDALALRALVAHERCPEDRIQRLLRQAGDLDARAAPAWAEAAALHGKAAWRAAHSEFALAGQIRAQAQAAERFAANLEEQALAARLDVAALRAHGRQREHLAEVAA